MRNIYRIPSPRVRITAARALLVVLALGLAGLATRTQRGADVVSHAAATPAAAQASAAATPAASETTYFPAQYELHAGAPQPHIEAF